MRTLLMMMLVVPGGFLLFRETLLGLVLIWAGWRVYGEPLAADEESFMGWLMALAGLGAAAIYVDWFVDWLRR